MSGINKMVEILHRCLWVRNTERPDEALFFNEDEHRIMPELDLKVTYLLYGKRDADMLWRDKGYWAKFIYDPYAELGPVGENEQGFPIFNTYAPPKWRHANYFLGDLILPEHSIPTLIDRFLTHFTAEHAESKEFLLDFLATALRKRNGSYLCILSKTQGTGKGVLGEMCRTIFGDGNMRKVRGDTLNNRFNAAFLGRQFIMFDEFDFKNKETLDRAKDLVNAELEIEKKGVDAFEISNTVNVYLATNRLEGLKEPGRRFSIPMTSDRPLKEFFSDEEIKRLQYDEKMIFKFARFLWWREVKRDMQVPFLSERANEIREANLSEWERLLCEEFFPCVPKGVFVPLESLQAFLKRKSGHGKAVPGRARMSEFAKKFPEFFVFDREANLEGIKEFGIRSIGEFTDFQPGLFCEECRTIESFCTHSKRPK